METTAANDLLRLAGLFADTFELGARKAELDVGDEVCRQFGIQLEDFENQHRGWKRAGLSDRQQKKLRKEVAELLAKRARSPANLMTAVAKSGAKFLEMVNEIYVFLSHHDATTKQPAEEFRFRCDDVELDLVLSSAFLESVRQFFRAMVVVETGSVDEEKLRGFLGVDGDFYGVWPMDPTPPDWTIPSWPVKPPKPVCHLPREITFLAWLRDQLARRGNDFEIARQRLTPALAAAQRLVDQAMDFVESQVDGLKLAAADPTKADEPAPDKDADHHVRVRHVERHQFRERGWLRSGLTPATFGVAAPVGSNFLHVDMSQFFETSHIPGSAADCLKATDDRRDTVFGGTVIGNLACLCGIWKAGVRRPPRQHDSDGLWDALDQGNASAVARWLSELTARLDEAERWLREDVWHATGAVLRKRTIEVVERFLNLPMWRHRWLLYEIWLIVATMNAAERSGWVGELRLKRDGAVTWDLPAGDAAAMPCATLRLQQAPAAVIEVWYQDRRPRNGVDIKPDVSLQTPAPARRDLVIVEGKDKYRMQARGAKGAKAVGNKYHQAARADITWIVNYSPFDDALLHPDTNHGDAWHKLHFASEFKPGHVPEFFARSIGQALLPPELRTIE